MPISQIFKQEIEAGFDKCKAHTTSQAKKVALEDKKNHLLHIGDGEPNAETANRSAYEHLYKAINTANDPFRTAIDIKTGIGRLSSLPSKTRMEMDALLHKLESRIEGVDQVSVGLLKDSKGRGLAKVIPTGANKIGGAYDITAVPQGGQYIQNPKTVLEIQESLTRQETARFITKGDLFNIFNKAGLDYKGQANYANLILLIGGGLDIKVNLIALFCPPAAALGFSGSVKVSGNLLKGSKNMFAYTEVINGNNQGWQLPNPVQIKADIIEKIKNNLITLNLRYRTNAQNEQAFFDANSITTGLNGLRVEDLSSTQAILDRLAEIQFVIPGVEGVEGVEAVPDVPAIAYTTNNLDGGAYDERLCDAVGKACSDIEHGVNHQGGISRKPAGDGNSYNALVVAGCMQGVAWEWMLKGGVEVAWSPLNVAAIKDYTKYLSSQNWSSAEALQYAALGISCSLTAEASAGGTWRTFFAYDKNARIYVKGIHEGAGQNVTDTYANTHENLSAYISDCIRYSTDISLKDYADITLKRVFSNKIEMGVGVSISLNTGSLVADGKTVPSHKISSYNFKALKLEELKRIAEDQRTKIQTALPGLGNNTGDLPWMSAKLSHLISLLDDRIQATNDHVISRFILCYNGRTTELGAKADAKLGVTVKSVQKYGFSDDPKSGQNSALGVKGLELVASLINAAGAWKKSHYILQVPLIKTGANQTLPVEVTQALAVQTGAIQVKDLWDNLPNVNYLPGIIRMKTQETDVYYRQISCKFFEKLQLDGNLFGGVSKSWNMMEQSKPKYSFINTIHYKTAIAVWEAGPLANNLQLCVGSGRCYGQAMVLTELIELGRASRETPRSPATVDKLQILAKSLHMRVEDLSTFFKSSDFIKFEPEACQGGPKHWSDENFAAQEGCVLIESIFKREHTDQVTLTKKNIENSDLRNHPEERFNVKPEKILESSGLPDVVPNEAGGYGGVYTPQSIRLRYRMADLKEDKSTPFKLGLFLPGTFELGIRIEVVENAGMSGIVDLVTYWFEIGSGSVMYNRNDAVAATVLITQ